MSKLALFGGEPLFKNERPLEDRWPETLPEDLEAIHRVIESGQFLGINHPEIEAAEKEISEYFNVDYVLLMGSGTCLLYTSPSPRDS